MCRCLAVLMLTALLAPQSRAQAPTSTAMLPVSAVGVTLDELPGLERLDEALRAALAKDERVSLQPKSTTLAHLGSARDVGLSCASDDTPCLSKLTILTEVQSLVVTSASIRGESFDVSLALVDGEGGRQVAKGLLPAAEPALGEAARLLVDALLTAPRTSPTSAEARADAVAAVQPPPTAPPSPKPAPAPEPAAEVAQAGAVDDAAPEEGGGSWLWLGLGAAAASTLAAGAGVAVVLAALALSQPPEGPAVIVMP